MAFSYLWPASKGHRIFIFYKHFGCLTSASLRISWVIERNLARNTQHSYRDTLVLLIPFIVEKLSIKVDKLKVTDITAELVRQFLLHLEQTRECSIATRNQRL